MKKIFALLLVLVVVLALLPAPAAEAEQKAFSITGTYVSIFGECEVTVSVGDRCSICKEGVLYGEFQDARGNLPARHYIRCTNQYCKGTISEKCSSDAPCGQEGYCQVCGNLYHGVHDYRVVNKTNPTCTEVGYRCDCWYCVKCQQYLDEVDAVLTDVVIPALGHTPGEPVREEPYLIPVLYDMVTYCTVCGKELSRVAHVGMRVSRTRTDPFTTFCEFLTLDIQNAQPDQVLELDARQWYGLQWRVLEALAARPDVSLKLLCYVNETAAELTIPAGFDLISSLEPGQFLHFNELAKMLG